MLRGLVNGEGEQKVHRWVFNFANINIGCFYIIGLRFLNAASLIWSLSHAGGGGCQLIFLLLKISICLGMKKTITSTKYVQSTILGWFGDPKIQFPTVPSFVCFSDFSCDDYLPHPEQWALVTMKLGEESRKNRKKSDCVPILGPPPPPLLWDCQKQKKKKKVGLQINLKSHSKHFW